MPEAKKILITMGIVVLTMKLVMEVPELKSFVFED